MPRKTRKKRDSGGTATAEALLTLPVTYGSLTIGDEVASLGLSVERKYLNLSAADRHLVGKRLVGAITATPGSDNPEQGQLFEDEQRVDAAFDVKSFRVTRKYISFGVSCKIESVDVETLSHFAKRSGVFSVHQAGDIPQEPKPAASPGASKDDADESPE